MLVSRSRNSTPNSSILLDGIRWPTFQALIAELDADSQHQLTYSAQRLEVSHLPPVTTVTPVHWTTYAALMAEAQIPTDDTRGRMQQT